MQAGIQFTYPGGMEGWVDLVDLIAPQPGVEPVTFRSRVRRRTTAPPGQWLSAKVYDSAVVCLHVSQCILCVCCRWLWRTCQQVWELCSSHSMDMKLTKWESRAMTDTSSLTHRTRWLLETCRQLSWVRSDALEVSVYHNWCCLVKAKGPDIYIPPLTEKPKQQQFTIQSGILSCIIAVGAQCN